MRMIAVDHGEARIGVAVCDETGTLARPLKIVRHTSRQADAQAIALIAAEQNAEKIIVGMPSDSEGQVSPQGRRVERWVEALRQETNLPIELWDESFSTQTTTALMRHRKKSQRRQPADDRAAAVILQSYLDARKDP